MTTTLVRRPEYTWLCILTHFSLLLVSEDQEECCNLLSWSTKEEVSRNDGKGTADYTDKYGEANNQLNERKCCWSNSPPA